jgi:hypothetical protein
MWMRLTGALVGLALTVSLAEAQVSKVPDPKAPAAARADVTADTKTPDKAADTKAGEFRLQDVGSIAEVPVAQLKPKTIVFADHPPENLVDPGTGFMRYEDWAKGRPIEQQFLGLYPGYAEPNADLVVDGVKKPFKEKLHMYVASARFSLSRSPASLDLPRLIALPFVEQIDPAIKDTLISASDVTPAKELKVIYNLNPKRRWCEGRPTVICVRSHYALEGKFPLGIQLANKIRDTSKTPVAPFLDFESEFTLRTPAEVKESGLTKLTGLDTAPIGAIEQSIFYINQVMQFGKLLAVFQEFPGDPNKTAVTVFMALAVESNVLDKKKEFAMVPVLRNLVPAQVLAGKSSFNTGRSLSAGLPVYGRSSVTTIASLLEHQ